MSEAVAEMKYTCSTCDFEDADKVKAFQHWRDDTTHLFETGLMEEMKDQEIPRPRNLTGCEVRSQQGLRGVVTDGIPRKSGVWKGRVSVMWIGGHGETIENPADLTVITRGIFK